MYIEAPFMSLRKLAPIFRDRVGILETLLFVIAMNYKDIASSGEVHYIQVTVESSEAIIEIYLQVW